MHSKNLSRVTHTWSMSSRVSCTPASRPPLSASPAMPRRDASGARSRTSPSSVHVGPASDPLGEDGTAPTHRTHRRSALSLHPTKRKRRGREGFFFFIVLLFIVLLFYCFIVLLFITYLLFILPSGEKGSSHPFNSGNLGPREAE
jgi:hypothetical protein